jgi:hypothetical protein
MEAGRPARLDGRNVRPPSFVMNFGGSSQGKICSEFLGS